MDKIQKEAVKTYQKLANAPRDKATSAGRFAFDNKKEKIIWKDIKNKLNLRKNSTLLDIGCGFGGLLEECLNDSAKMNIELTLVDIPAIAKETKKILTKFPNVPAQVSGGVFPTQMPKKFFQKKFDFILAYSVLHYTAKPEQFIEQMVSMLNEGGKLLIGDLPNVNMKGRFLCSEFGKKFEANYKKVSINDLPVFKNHQDYAKKQKIQNPAISDNLIFNVLKKYRQAGFNVFMLPQDLTLPFSYTREDILIEKK